MALGRCAELERMNIHICDFTTVADIKRGKHRFDFSDRFGPLFLNAKGEPLKRQPQPGSAAWAAFEEWFRDRSSTDCK
jgi:hypothetical protein